MDRMPAKSSLSSSAARRGWTPACIARADAKLSLGRLTWPHMLVRAMLAEQIYRAQMITAGHPYHRAGPAVSAASHP